MRAILRHPYWLAYLLTGSAALGSFWALSGRSAWAGMTLVIALVLHPLLDSVSGRFAGAPVSALERGRIYSWLLWIYVPFQTAVLLYVLSLLARGQVGLWAALSLGMVTGGVGITAAHELVHRRLRAERALGLVLLAQVSYMHFRVEHVYGHHRNVSTPLDPASARLGESSYAFVLRSVFGSWRHAWHIEAARGGLRNRVLQYALIQLVVVAAIFAWGGLALVGWFALQSFVAIFLLELINYVEHYGLNRRELAPGRYEPVTTAHSWDTRQRLTSYLLFNLGLHSDHHLAPLKPYEALEPQAGARETPLGYTGMLLMSLVPPLWWRVMNPLVMEIAL